MDRGPRPAAAASTDVNLVQLLVFICTMLSALSVPAFSGFFGFLHEVPEGHVGVYWRGGALSKTITDPGFHLKIPFLTRYEPIQVTIQTDEDVYIDMFDQIDEKMKEAIQNDCTIYAPGIEIISVRVTKPKIPEAIARNYEQMEEERTKFLIEIEKQKVAEKEAETQKLKAVTEAEKDAHVSKILMEQRMMEKESIKLQQKIENEMYFAQEKSIADSNFYKFKKEAEANKLLLTPAYLELKFMEAVANDTKIVFGDKVPNMVLDQRLLQTDSKEFNA